MSDSFLQFAFVKFFVTIRELANYFEIPMKK